MRHTFPKSEKLCGRTSIDHLYRHGKRFVAWPLRVTYISCRDVNQVLIWAPKSLFKRAVHRNHLRRLIREAYRLQKDVLDNVVPVQMAFNYIDKEQQPFEVIAKSMRKALQRIVLDLSSNAKIDSDER